MIVTEWTRECLHYRRTVKKWLAEGYEQVGECGGNLWQLYRGSRQHCRIIDARVAPDGMSVYVKIEPTTKLEPKTAADYPVGLY